MGWVGFVRELQTGLGEEEVMSWQPVDEAEITSEVTRGMLHVGGDMLITTDEEAEQLTCFYLPDEYRICKRVDDDQEIDHTKIYFLIGKWKYDPARRLENKAGSEPVTDKQRKYMLDLMRSHPSEFAELMVIIRMCWGIWFDEWTKADAMFVINALALPKRKLGSGQ